MSKNFCEMKIYIILQLQKREHALEKVSRNAVAALCKHTQ